MLRTNTLHTNKRLAVKSRNSSSLWLAMEMYRHAALSAPRLDHLSKRISYKQSPSLDKDTEVMAQSLPTMTTGRILLTSIKCQKTVIRPALRSPAKVDDKPPLPPRPSSRESFKAHQENPQTGSRMPKTSHNPLAPEDGECWPERPINLEDCKFPSVLLLAGDSPERPSSNWSDTLGRLGVPHVATQYPGTVDESRPT